MGAHYSIVYGQALSTFKPSAHSPNCSVETMVAPIKRTLWVKFGLDTSDDYVSLTVYMLAWVLSGSGKKVYEAVVKWPDDSLSFVFVSKCPVFAKQCYVGKRMHKFFWKEHHKMPPLKRMAELMSGPPCKRLHIGGS